MTDPLSGWALFSALSAAGGAGALGASMLSDSDKPEAPDGPDVNAMKDLPVAPTQAKAPGSDKTQADYASQQAREAERRRAGQRQGRSGTILTGSLGVTGGNSTAPKTLLGA